MTNILSACKVKLMSGTRNKNNPGNYVIEQASHQKERLHLLYPYGSSGHAFKSSLPGDGLLPNRTGSMELSENFVDIETRLLGISSNNLVNPLPELNPSLYTLPTLNLYKKPDILYVRNPDLLKDQRLRLVSSEQVLQRTQI